MSQIFVSSLVSFEVIYLLEKIHIDHQQRHRQPGTPGSNDLTVQRRIERVAVGNPSQAIDADKFFKLFVRGEQRLFGFKYPALSKDIECAVSRNRQKNGCQPDEEMRLGCHDAHGDKSHGEKNWASASDRAGNSGRWRF